MKVEEAIQGFEQASFTQGRNPAPIRNKTQRTTSVCFMRSVTRKLGERIWYASSLAFLSVVRSRLDRCTEGEGELKREEESSEALTSSFCVEARWQIAGAGR